MVKYGHCRKQCWRKHDSCNLSYGKDKGGPEIKFQLLLWPVADSDFSRESYEKYAEGRFLTTNMMKWMWDNYAPDTEKRNEYYASPLKASPKN